VLQRAAGRPLDLLRRARDFRLLFVAAIGSGLGTRLAVLALMVDVWDRTQSGKWVAALLVTDFVPIIVIGLLLGSFLDRFSRRRLMIASDLLRCAVFVALPFATSATMVVVLAGVVGFATGFFRPAVYAGLPNLVDDDDLPHANGVFQAGENLTWMLGPLLGSVLLWASGPDVAYWFNALTFLVSALLIMRIAELLLQSEKALTEGHWRDITRGFRVVRESRALLTVLVAWSLMMLAIGHSDVAQVELAKVDFDAGDFGLGLLMAAIGLGLVIGSLGAGWAAGRFGTGPAYVTAIAMMAAGLLIVSIVPNVWVAAVVVVGMGVGNGVAVVANSVLVQRGAEDRVRGRALTLVMSVNYSVLFVGMMLGGFVSDALGARMTWTIAGSIATVAALSAYVLSRGIETPGLTRPHATPAPIPIVSAAAEADARRE
jgi:MFS family permease